MATLEVQIDASNTDAQELAGTMNLTGGSLNANATNGYIGLIFYGLSDIVGATINSAYLQVYVTSGSFDDPNVTIYGHDDDTTLTVFTTTSNEISGLTSTTANAAWSASSLGVGWETSPAITSVIQEIVDIPGRTSDRLTVIIKGASAGSLLRIQSYDGDPTQAAKLTLDYTPAARTLVLPRRNRQYIRF